MSFLSRKKPPPRIGFTAGGGPPEETIELNDSLGLDNLKDLFPKFFYQGDDDKTPFKMLEGESYHMHRGQLIVSGDLRFSSNQVEHKTLVYIVFRKVLVEDNKEYLGEWDIFNICPRLKPKSVQQARSIINSMIDAVGLYSYGVIYSLC